MAQEVAGKSVINNGFADDEEKEVVIFVIQRKDKQFNIVAELAEK